MDNQWLVLALVLLVGDARSDRPAWFRLSSFEVVE